MILDKYNSSFLSFFSFRLRFQNALFTRAVIKSRLINKRVNALQPMRPRRPLESKA